MLKPSEKFDGVVSVRNRAHHHKVDRSLVPVADSPSLSSAASFQDLVSRTAQGQGQCHQSVQISFDEEDGPHQFSGWPVITVVGNTFEPDQFSWTAKIVPSVCTAILDGGFVAAGRAGQVPALRDRELMLCKCCGKEFAAAPRVGLDPLDGPPLDGELLAWRGHSVGGAGSSGGAAAWAGGPSCERLGLDLGIFLFFIEEELRTAEPTMAAAYKNALSRLRSAGVSIRPIDIAGTLAKHAEANLTVMLYEGARFHKQRYEQYGNRLADLADLVRQGLQISVDRYDETLRYIDSCRAQFAEQFKRTPVMLTPAAMGPAPAGLASTGDPRMNAPWTALGTPAVSIPMPVGTALPLGLQLTAEHGGEARVLHSAVRLQTMLGSQPI